MNSPSFIKNTNNRYTITKNGTIFDLKKNRTLKIGGKNGRVSIINEHGIQQFFTLTRILWETFNGTISNNHIIKKININNDLHIDNLVCIPSHLKHANPTFKSLDGFKPIIGYEDRYLISEDARIFSIISDKFLVINIGKNNYISIGLIDSNFKYNKYYLHRLVYCTYHNLPLDCDIIIDHIDQNKKNNHLSNLRILSKSENNKNCVKKSLTIHNPIIQYDKNNKFIAEHHSLSKISKQLHCDYRNIKKVLNMNILCKNEFFWTQYQVITDGNYVCVKVDGEYYPNYKVNKNGDVINKFNKKLQFSKNNNYYKITLSKNNKMQQKFVHRIVYESFNPNIDLDPKKFINHKDENRQNNNIENLEVVNHKQNITYSLGKKTAQLDDDDQIIKIFDSISEACCYLKKIDGASNISKVCHGEKKTAYGYKWIFI